MKNKHNGLFIVPQRTFTTVPKPPIFLPTFNALQQATAISENMHAVYSVVGACPRHLKDDMDGVGVLALITAVSMYCEERDGNFAIFALSEITKAIEAALESEKYAGCSPPPPQPKKLTLVVLRR